MHKTHAPARAMSLLSVALLLGAGLPVFAASSAEAGARYFEEDWELGSSGWTYSSPNQPIAQQDCTGRFAYCGLCSIEVNSQFRGQVASVSRTFASLQLADRGYVTSGYFQAEFPYAKSGCAVVVEYGSGVKATLNLSYGSGNQVALSLQTPTGAASTGALTTPSGRQWMYDQAAWYRPLLKMDLMTSQLRVEVRAANDSLLAAGPALTLPTGSGSTIERIAYESHYYGNGGLTERPAKCNFDWLTITGPDAPTPPQLLTALPGPGLGQVTVSWQAPLDDGGVPVLHYNVYRGDSANNVTTLIGNTTTRSFVDSGMANGEAHHYAASAVNAAGEGAKSNVFLGTTFNVPSAPRNLAATPGANVGEVRLTWQAPLDNGGAAITGYHIHRGTESGNATLLAQLGNVLGYTDTHRPNGTRWYYNVTAANFVGEGPSGAEASSLPKPDGATAPTALVLRPDPWWTDHPRTLNFTYSAAVSQCAPTQSCPVTHEWRVYQDGSLTGADGILLANGTNTHEGHAELTTYNVATTLTPTGPDGTHRLKVAVAPRQGGTQWQVSSLGFQNGLPHPDPRCNANPAYFSYIMPGMASPAPGARLYTKSYAYKLDGATSAFRATFADGCPSNGTLGQGDGRYELGYGGILLDRTAVGGTIQLFDSTGNPTTFVLGTDNDGSGVIGDSALDCFAGPFDSIADVTCPADADGKIVLLLVASNPDAHVPGPSEPIWGRGKVCVPIGPIERCALIGYYSTIAFQSDPDGNGLGDGFENFVNNTAGGVDHLIGVTQDQEFATICGPADCVGRGTGDRLPNLQEFRWETLPLGPLKICDQYATTLCWRVFENARDHDNDSWEDGPEHAYWNNPDNDPALDDPTWATISSAPYDKDSELTFDDDAQDGGTLHDPDNDDDGLLDGEEYRILKSYPEFADSDCALASANCSLPGPSYWSTRWGEPGKGDQINDTAERHAWFTLANATGLALSAWMDDHDRDGVVPNLLDPDSDADGLFDGLEFNTSVGGKCLASCTSPAKYDTDRDGLLDGANVRVGNGDHRVQLFIQGKVAYVRDAGGYTFYGEATAGTSKTNPDTDGDGLPDGWEVKYGTHADEADAEDDPDADGSTNSREYAYNCTPSPCAALPVHWGGTNPMNPDSDNDGLFDGAEDYDADGARDPGEPSPLEPDSDRDGLKDGAELNPLDGYHRSDPAKADTDGDRLTDYQEVVTYLAKGISPTVRNSDGWTNQDTLDDYQEVVLYRTNPEGRDLQEPKDGKPDGWDTDGDGVPDGVDDNPLRNDSPPPPRQIPPLNPTRTGPESYVNFRRDGYIDVYVKDPHGAEANIDLVDVWVNLTGTVDGASGYVTLRQEARRLEEAGTWGARIPFPDGLGVTTKQEFRLTIASLDGGNADATLCRGSNTCAYGATWYDTIDSPVSWRDQTDPTDDWESLKVHDNIPAHSSTSAGHNGAPLVPTIDPWTLSLDDLQNILGVGKVYRLKPGAVLASELGNATLEIGNTSALAIAHPINATLGEGNESWSVNFTYFEDAWELVDPLSEPGLYASMAAGGSNEYRTPKFIHAGAKWAWGGVVQMAQGAKREGASFLFGSDDPRAEGAILGDIVSGILVYGDVRDCVWKDDLLTVTLGCIGIALTFVGPQADGPFAAFKAGVKTLTAIPTVGSKVALKFAADVSAGVIVAKNEKNVVKGLKFLVDQCSSASWLRANRGKAIPFDHVQRSVPAQMRNDVGGQLPLVVDYAESLRAAYPTQVAKIDAILDILTRPNLMFGTSGEAALKEIGVVVARVREVQPEGAADFAKGIGYAAGKSNGAGKLPGIEGADRWKNDIFPGVTGNNELGRKGFILEGKIVGRAGDEFYWIADASNVDRLVVLTKLDVMYVDVPVLDETGKNIVRRATVQVDVEGVMDGSGKKLFIDAKSADEIGDGEYVQMEEYAALAKQKNGEVIWFLEGTPTPAFQNHVATLVDRYKTRIHLIDANSGESLNPYI